MEIGGVRWFLPRGKHHSSLSTFYLLCFPICGELLSARAPPNPFRQSCAGAGALHTTLKTSYMAFQSCVESLRLASGQVLSFFQVDIVRSTLIRLFFDGDYGTHKYLLQRSSRFSRDMR